jgi:hypothetical protein
MNHLICKQHLYVDFNGSETGARALHGKLSDWCRDSLTPALERALDRCAPSHEYWSLERLEINVGAIAIDRLEQDLPLLIEQALEKSLRAQTPALSYSEPTATFACHQRVAEGALQQSAHQRLMSAWFYFLKTGVLPWNIKMPEGENLEHALLTSWQEHPARFNPQSMLPVLADATVRRRLVLQFSKPFLATLLEHIAPAVKAQLTVILQTLENSKLPADTVNAFAIELWQSAFEPYRHTKTDRETVHQAWQNLPVKTFHRDRLANLLEQYWPGTTGTGPVPSQAKKTAEKSTLEQKPGKSTDIKAWDSRLPFPAQTGAQSSRQSTGSQTKLHPEAGEGIYIDNAGLVILHPFLPQFFNALNIANGDGLSQPERALCLLHFLSTGQTVAPEYELVLPKVLCNIPLTTPVETDVALTIVEREEAEALLAAVIGHWDALKNTGIDGLRGAFLLRSGKIAWRDDGDWLLQVENKGYDILLEQLPWGIGAIKLPWMESMLWVEWSA